MRTTFARALAALALAGLLAVPAAGSTPAPVRDGASIERLCPLSGGIGPLAGRLGERLPEADIGPFDRLDSALAPFTMAETDLTSWSGKLAAVTYRAAHDGATDLSEWEAQTIDALEAAGWQRLGDDDPVRPSSFESTQFAKVIGPDGQTRRMVIEVGASGAFMLRCGDYDLLKLAADEADGRLAPGSPRPAIPQDPVPVLPDPAVCAAAPWRDAFAKVRAPDQLGPALLTQLPAAFPAPDRAHQAERLNRWLHWKMLESGQFDQDALWRIEQRTDDGADKSADFETFVIDAAATFEADKAGDPVARCRSMLKLLAGQYASDSKEAARIAKVNAALEAAVRAEGVTID